MNKNYLNNVSNDAIEFEDMALFFIKNYCETDRIAFGIFFEQLANYFSDHVLEKKRSENEGYMQKENNAYMENSENQASRGVNGIEGDAFKEAFKNRKDFYITKKQYAIDSVNLENPTDLRGFMEKIKNSMGDPMIARDLKFFRDKSQKLYGNMSDIATSAQSPEEVMKQAEILGLIYY